jgi:hypothetical protein
LDAARTVGLHWLARNDDRERGKGGDEAAAFLFDDEAGLAELVCVFAGALVVGYERDAAGLKDANDLAKRLMASGCAVDVVEAEVDGRASVP